jgi:preprotein translocase SecE subunit
MKQFTQYLLDTASEMKQVKWPTAYQTLIYSVLVIAISAIVALFLGAFDYLFGQGIQIILNTLY